MITPEQRIQLKKLLRGDYIHDVKEKLSEKKILSKNKTPYSDKMISHVFNGRYDNQAIENAILEVYIARKEQQIADQRYKNEILGLPNSSE